MAIKKKNQFRCMWCDKLAPRKEIRWVFGNGICSNSCAEKMKADPYYQRQAKKTGMLTYEVPPVKTKRTKRGK